MLPWTARTAAIAAALLISATACGTRSAETGTDPDSDPTTAAPTSTSSGSSEAPAAPEVGDGLVLSTDNFAIVMPKGWQEITKRVNSPTIALAAVDRYETDETPSTIKVEHPLQAVSDLAAAGDIGVQMMKADGANQVRAESVATACGVPAVKVTGTKGEPGAEVKLTQYAITTGSEQPEETWLVTFSTSKWLSKKDFRAFVTDPIATCQVKPAN